MLAVSHSPTPSSVRIAASSYGDGEKAHAAWLSWWLVKAMRFLKPPPSAARISRGRCSFVFSHCGIAVINERSPRGATAR